MHAQYVMAGLMEKMVNMGVTSECHSIKSGECSKIKKKESSESVFICKFERQILILANAKV